MEVPHVVPAGTQRGAVQGFPILGPKIGEIFFWILQRGFLQIWSDLIDSFIASLMD